MQRPRRTSEFQEDRQSRAQQRSTTGPSPSGGGTAKKYSSRQSRIAVSNRPSSSDRGAHSHNPYLSVPSSVVQNKVTPQKTPLNKPTANRVLFTNEKLRTANKNPVALHNDKKWIHEQTQRITEHLLNQETLGGGISTDFLNKGLRQMSIKQFVAIINYFLAYIWGNRYTVGANYVEDIIAILQKLKYPHAINKSWLKTPNTQHSFGNVVLLFDFLMDFLPNIDDQGDTLENSDQFVLNEPEELGNNDPLQIPDLEFQQELLRNSEKAFMLWDKNIDDEFDCLQKQTCNLLIQKLSGIPNIEAIEMEIQKLETNSKSLKNERIPVDKDAVKMRSKLKHELTKIRRDINSICEESERYDRSFKDINSRKMALAKDVENMEIDIKSLHEILAKQMFTVEQRDQLITDLDQHKNILAIEERTIQDLQERNHNQQIQFARALKQFNDQVELFNKRMREIKFSDLIKSKKIQSEHLELSLRPAETQLDDLTKRIPLLKQIKAQIQKRLQDNKSCIQEIQQHCKQLIDDLNTKLHPHLNDLRSAHSANNSNLEQFLHHLKEEEFKLSKKLQEVDKELLLADDTIEEFNQLIAKKQSQVDEFKQTNEQKMQDAEKRHEQCAAIRMSFIQAYDEILNEQSVVLQQLTQQVELQEKQLEEFRKDIQNCKK